MPCLLFLISYSSEVFADFQIKLRASLYDSLISLFCGIFGSLLRQWWYMASLKICGICGIRYSNIAFSLSPYSNKTLISGAHRWEIKYTYLQDIYCIVKPWIQRNKTISQIKMCMCSEWMVYDDDGDNNGESLILLLLFEGIHTFLAFWNFLRRMRCSSFSFLSGGYLVLLILLSDTCPFLLLVSLFLFFRGSGHLPLFISSYLFLEHSSLEII